MGDERTNDEQQCKAVLERTHFRLGGAEHLRIVLGLPFSEDGQEDDEMMRKASMG